MFPYSDPKMIARQIKSLMDLSQQQVRSAESSLAKVQDPAIRQILNSLVASISVLNTLMILALAPYTNAE